MCRVALEGAERRRVCGRCMIIPSAEEVLGALQEEVTYGTTKKCGSTSVDAESMCYNYTYLLSRPEQVGKWGQLFGKDAFQNSISRTKRPTPL